MQNLNIPSSFLFYRCKRCQYSANILASIHTHYKIKHADAAESPDFEEGTEDEQQASFTQEFWKAEWDIPTLAERKAMVEGNQKQEQPMVYDVLDDDDDVVALDEKPARGVKRKKGSPAAGKGAKAKKAKKQQSPAGKINTNIEAEGFGPTGRELHQSNSASSLASTSSSSLSSISKMLASATPGSSQEAAAAGAEVAPPPSKAVIERIMEISPFELSPTYKCLSCPKRTQTVERMRRHMELEHPDKTDDEAFKEGAAYKTMTRDQVVDMLTPQIMPNLASEDDLRCFYCEDVSGGIRDLEAHFASAHSGDTVKVLRGGGAGAAGGKKGAASGYLECQLCGHLTQGFERSKQKVHFHEDHPLESVVNAHKYVSKRSSSTPALSRTSSTSSTSGVKDLSRFNGTPMRCPRPGCDFETRSLSAANSHLRRHTQTFRCGHCGKTHSSSQEFHRHSAMMHGDKIPDQVKDPEADAELEALKAMLEAELLEMEEEEGVAATPPQPQPQPAKIKKNPTARKSTSQTPTAIVKRQIATKSTGGGRRRWGMSVYGAPFDPPDLSAVTTKMALGGLMEMTVSADKMAELVNLAPKVLVKDIGANLGGQ